MNEIKSTTTPLLASEQDAPTSLFSVEEEEDISDFSRLISVVHNSGSSPASSGRIARAHRDQHQIRVIGDDRRTSLPKNSSFFNPYFVTIVAGTSSLWFFGFVWASFVSDSWADTVLAIDLTIPFLPKQVIPLLSTGLASILQQFSETGQIGSAVLLWVTSLMIPCLLMVASPAWIMGSFQISLYVKSSKFREWLELSIRWAWTVVFVMAFTALAYHYIVLTWTDSVIAVHTKMNAGLVSFAVGITFAALTIVILRLQTSGYAHASNDMRVQDTTVDTFMFATSSPAIEFPRLGESHSDPNLEIDNEEEAPMMMRILEEAPTPIVAHAQNNIRQRIHDAPLASETAARNNTQAVHPSPPSFFQMLFVFQTGLLSILLWIPSLLFPAIRFEFNGVAAELMKDKTQIVCLYEVPFRLYQDNLAAETPSWIIAAIGIVLFIPTILCPVIATVLGLATWFLSPDKGRNLPRKFWSRSVCRLWLYAIHPAVGSVTLALALFVAVHVAGPWSKYLLNGGNSSSDGVNRGLCSTFSSVTGELCLTLTGNLMQGAWFFAAQSVLLEVFIVFTLRWS